MNDEDVPIKMDSALLAVAFPGKYRAAATVAGNEVVRCIDQRYWWGQFTAKVGGEAVLIPVRLHFGPEPLALPKSDDAWLFSRALQTRSTDGFQRQRALADLLQQPTPWSAPFIVTLIGGYVIEILDDILAALSTELEQRLGSFINNNPSLWATTKSRVTSYWNVYYRRRGAEGGRVFSRDEYAGFKIVERLDDAATQNDGSASL